MAAILENGGHIEILRGPRFFSWIVTPIEYLCKICCLYHNLNDSYSYLLSYWGRIHNACVCSAMLHASEKQALATPSLKRLHRNDTTMMRWVYNMRHDQIDSSECLLNNSKIQNLESRLRTNRLRWHGHVTREEDEWINQVRSREGLRRAVQGKPKKSNRRYGQQRVRPAKHTCVHACLKLFALENIIFNIHLLSSNLLSFWCEIVCHIQDYRGIFHNAWSYLNDTLNSG